MHPKAEFHILQGHFQNIREYNSYYFLSSKSMFCVIIDTLIISYTYMISSHSNNCWINIHPIRLWGAVVDIFSWKSKAMTRDLELEVLPWWTLSWHSETSQQKNKRQLSDQPAHTLAEALLAFGVGAVILGGVEGHKEPVEQVGEMLSLLLRSDEGAWVGVSVAWQR